MNMEVQLHHFNPWFESYDEALEHPGQTMAIAVLFEVYHSASVFTCKNTSLVTGLRPPT